MKPQITKFKSSKRICNIYFFEFIIFKNNDLYIHDDNAFSNSTRCERWKK